MTDTKSQLTVTQTELNSTQQELVQTNQTLDNLKSIFLHNGTVYNNHLYFTSNRQPANITLFQQKCQEKGGYLAEINDEEEHKFLKSYLTSLNHDAHQYYFIGITDEGHTGRWTYMTSGDDVTFTKWGSSEPGNNGRDHCVYWRHTATLDDWADYYCVNNHGIFRYLCEMNL